VEIYFVSMGTVIRLLSGMRFCSASEALFSRNCLKLVLSSAPNVVMATKNPIEKVARMATRMMRNEKKQFHVGVIVVFNTQGELFPRFYM